MSDYVNNCVFDYTATYYKVCGANRGDIEYDIGLVKDTVPFNPMGSCLAGGIYFVEKKELKKYYGEYGYQVAELTIPTGTPVYLDSQGGKWKAPQVEIVRFLGMTELIDLGLLTEMQKKIATMDEKNKTECYTLLCRNWNLFPFVPDKYKTGGIRTLDVDSPGHTLQHVPQELHGADLCKLAVISSVFNLRYIPKELLTAELCEIAVKKSGEALRYVPQKLRTMELCALAVYIHGDALEYVPPELRTEELCEMAVANFGYSLQHVPQELRTERICIIAVRRSGFGLQHVPDHVRNSAFFKKTTGL